MQQHDGSQESAGIYPRQRLNIEFICVCYNFQRRLAWFLSSLVQQIYKPDITINLAYIRNNGNPCTEELIEFYKKDGINFRPIGFDNLEDIAYRGALRNAQIAVSRSDWLYFYDCDQVLAPDYFDKWKNILTDKDYIFHEKLKLFADPKETQILIDSTGKWITDAYQKANAIEKINLNTRNVAGGGGMMVRRELVYKTTGGLYSNSYKRKDRHFYKQKTLSDPIFKAKFKIEGHSVSPIIHLGHCRWADYKLGKTIQQ
jgi:hypothetical protein